MLSALQGEGLDGVAVAVARHFGGTKLGTGGLVRAYGAATRDCLRGAGRITLSPASALTIEAPLGDVGAVYACLAASGGSRVGEEAYSGEAVVLQATVPRDGLEGMLAALAGKTAGRAAWVVEEE